MPRYRCKKTSEILDTDQGAVDLSKDEQSAEQLPVCHCQKGGCLEEAEGDMTFLEVATSGMTSEPSPSAARCAMGNEVSAQ